MPLIDLPEVEIDQQLKTALASSFSTDSGLILDGAGLSWSLWRADGLEAWWYFFEETIDAPMGRKLANASCDEEEWLLGGGQLDAEGLFKRRKSLRLLDDRWWLHGWGAPSLKPCGIERGILTPIVSGILQADLEHLDGCRYRMRWEQRGPDATRLILDPSNAPLSPAGPSRNSSTYQAGSPFQIDVEAGWRIDGQQHCLLPAGMFGRIEESCAGLVAAISADERAAWPELSEGSLSMAIASYRLFIAGEELFMAIDSEGWLDTVDAVFGRKGLGTPLKVESIDSHGGVRLEYASIPLIGITLGVLAAAWTRCEGRPVKVEFSQNSASIIIELSSRHKLA